LSAEDGTITTPRQGLEPTIARRWTRTFLFVIFAACLVLGAFNFTINPYGYYPPRVLPPLTWSSRETKVALVERHADADALIIGSSRSMYVSPHQLGELLHHRFLNVAVDSATVEDWFAMYAFAHDRVGLPLREIVLGVDLEAFRNHGTPDGRLLGQSELRAQLSLDLRLRWLLNQSEQLLSLEQTLDSTRSVRTRNSRPAPTYYFDENDGFQHLLERKPLDPSHDAQLAAYEARFDGFTNVDAHRAEMFEDMLHRAEAAGIRVRGFVTPLHPALIARLRTTRDFDRLRELVIRYLPEIQKRLSNFTVVDFTDIASFGGDPEGFIDVAHADEKNLERAMVALVEPHALQ
jgi:hypothetical protein